MNPPPLLPPCPVPSTPLYGVDADALLDGLFQADRRAAVRTAGEPGPAVPPLVAVFKVR